ncbi:MAG: hypothetical protein IJ459_01855 [Clostridia bacterium]|nr:hypothetical protein [Clostridia bacterium]
MNKKNRKTQPGKKLLFGGVSDSPAAEVGKYVGGLISDGISPLIGGSKKEETNSGKPSGSISTSTEDAVSKALGLNTPREEPTVDTPESPSDVADTVGTVAPDAEEKVDSTEEASAEEPVKDYNYYYDREREYYEKYFGRDEFEYDADADELYQQYRAQALKSADRARRDTVAQAAGLTGGYGSSYAAAMGTAAYNDIMENADAMALEFYNAAKERHDAEGERLLTEAERAGAYGDMLYKESPEYQAAVAALGNENGGDEEYELLQSLRTTKGIYDFDGENDTGATWYDEAMRIYAGVATGTNRNVKEKYLGEHKNYTEAEIRSDLMTWEDKEGNHMSREQVDYLVNEIMGRREIAYISALESADGVKLLDYVSSLADSGISGEELYDKLSAFTDKSGKKLTSEQIIILMTSI